MWQDPPGFNRVSKVQFFAAWAVLVWAPHLRMNRLTTLAMLTLCCCGRTVAEQPGMPACRPPEPAGRQVLDLQLRVAKVGAGCDGVGGTPVQVRNGGRIYTRSLWQDPRASLVTEIWRGQFEVLVATGTRAAEQCVEAAVDVGPGLYAVRTCHAPDSAASAPDGFVPFTQIIYYP